MHSFGQKVRLKPFLVDKDVSDLRLKLIKEEVSELEQAIEQNNLIEIADALTDILYVVYGAGATYGIDLDACFKEVHRSNMSKLDKNGNPIYRKDGKVLKGPYYKPPDLESILFYDS